MMYLSMDGCNYVWIYDVVCNDCCMDGLMDVLVHVLIGCMGGCMMIYVCMRNMYS